ncbi:MAG: AAA family ATPase [Candidatus Binatia bacterium]
MQDEVVRALADPRFYRHRPAEVVHVQTHISHVFLAGPYVYKLKKPVRFPFLDFGTLALRERACADEVTLNSRLCPAVYLGVVPVVRPTAGGLALGGPGEVIDWVVQMRRLPADRMLVDLLARDAVHAEMLERLAVLLAVFHTAAAAGPEVARHGAPEALAAAWAENLAEAAPFLGTLIAPVDARLLADFGPRFVARHDALFRARQAGGRVREGHGDLHAEHVCFLDEALPGGPDLDPLAPGVYVFDCIEFSQPLRCNDVAGEIAFLAMDLEYRRRPDLGRAFAAAYAHAARDPDIATLLPFYAAHRACVRGKVDGIKSAEPEVEAGDRAAAAERARRYFRLAVRLAWRAMGPALVAVTGLSGTGKTTVATALAAHTGFRHLSSDLVRKVHAGLAPTTSARATYDTGLYTPAARTAVYEALAADADAALAAGEGVLVDATFLGRPDRDRLVAVAARRAVPLVFLACEATADTVRARLAARTGSPSDATWETYLEQRRRCDPFAPGEPHLALATDGTPAEVAADAVRLLWGWVTTTSP